MSVASNNSSLNSAGENLINLSLAKYLEKNGIDAELLEIPSPSSIPRVEGSDLHNHAALVAVIKKNYETIVENVSKSDKLMTVGGDTGSGLGSILALKKIYPQLQIVYITGKPNGFVMKNNYSRVFESMVASTLVGEGIYRDFKFGISPFKPFEVNILGNQDADRKEQEYVRGKQIHYYSMDIILRNGWKIILDKLAKDLGHKPIYVIFSLDALNNIFGLSNYHNLGGLDYRESKLLTKYLSKRDIKGVTVSNFDLSDKLEAKAELISELINDMLN